ncbi:MAG: DUF1922 domain-containing protein [Clostridiales bacterium]|nr:DUF1922 domain-containing protein [Candidatus Crickella equi]
MIYRCPKCGRMIYPHELTDEQVCPYCGCDELQETDEDEE